MESVPASELINAPAPESFTVSVRQLVDFVLRAGDLSSGTGRVPGRLRAQRGSQAHRKLQKTRPGEYEPEVLIQREVRTPEFSLTLLGRIDGLWPREGVVLLEEIKTVDRTWDYVADELHWAQLKLYGWMYCLEKDVAAVDLQLSYLHLETEQLTVFRDQCTREQLEAFAVPVVDEYLRWLKQDCDWRKLRNASIELLQFPYGKFREGQRKLCSAVYKTVLNSGRLFAEAPTGSGKTISALFPTFKALPKSKQDRIFFLTAKTTTQAMAEKALLDLKAAGLRVRAITITAREKVCVQDGKVCDPATCPMAKGYFDRRKPAMREALGREMLTPPDMMEVARKHNVCPHELSLDVSEWVDTIICDYNYVFDPSASLKRHFAENTDRKVLLIDEAHNLVDRARGMFSAELSVGLYRAARAAAPASNVRRALNKIEKQLEELLPGNDPLVFAEVPRAFMAALEKFLDAADAWFAQNPGLACEEDLLESYFRTISFLQIAEFYGPQYRTILQRDSDGTRIQLYCLDPATLLQAALERVDATVFISATLTPLDYFRTALGGDKDDELLQLASPFPADNLEVLVADRIATAFKQRSGSLDDLCAAIRTFVSARHGNYLVYFPSYAYLNEVVTRLQPLLPDARFLVQSPEMRTAERNDFITRFEEENAGTLVGFAVMGGIFGEGIDLVGETLIGVVIVGVGLPQVCLERNLIRSHFDEQGLDGFAYAYIFPGLNRVFQAAGRLIRSENDRGVILLLDTRFAEARFRDLFPGWWRTKSCGKGESLARALADFWGAPENVVSRPADTCQ